MCSSVNTPSRHVTPEFSRKPILGLTPVALMTRSASRRCPLDRRTLIGAPLPGDPASGLSIASTRVPVWTVTPLSSHQSLIIPPAVGPIMRGTMRSPISMTVSLTLRAASPSMMMQPMKPAPICNTRAPGLARSMIARASFSVQHACTPGPLMPRMGGEAGDEPVAISSVSNGSAEPSSSVTLRFAVSTDVARARFTPMRSLS
jgi:hypothetical protein